MSATTKEGYLTCYLPFGLPPSSQEIQEYVIEKETSFYFGLESHQPDHSVIVCVSLKFHLSNDDFHQLKSDIHDKVKKVLTDKGLPDVHVCVLMDDEEVGANNDIYLRVKVPENINESVTNQDIISELSQYLSQLGYNPSILSDVMSILIFSEQKVTFTSGAVDVVIPQGTRFNISFFEAAQNPMGVYSLKTKENGTVQYKKENVYELKYELKTEVIFRESILIVTLNYFFKPNSRDNRFRPKTIANYLGKEYKSGDFKYITVVTNVTSSYTVIPTQGPRNPQPDNSKRIGVHLTIHNRRSTNVPDMQGLLNTYFSNVRHGPYYFLPQDPPPSY